MRKNGRKRYGKGDRHQTRADAGWEIRIEIFTPKLYIYSKERVSDARF
jgi:hypothetical protein